MRRSWKTALAATTAILMLACGVIAPPTSPSPAPPPVDGAPSQEPPPALATQAGGEPSAGAPFGFPGGTLVIPTGLASGAVAEVIPAVDEQSGAPWDAAPEHVKISLQGYPLQGKFFEPQIMIYPASDYSTRSEMAAQSIGALQALLSNSSSPMSEQAMPHLPFANAAQVFAAQMQPIAFKSGQGIRTLTEYAQYVATANNHDLFYHFQGLTSSGEFYVVATLPINAAYLASESDPASPLPAGGVPFPGYEAADDAQFQAYYRSVTDLLNATPADRFQPSLALIDALFASLELTE